MRTANALILLLHTTCAFLNAPQIAPRTAVATNSGVTLHRPLPSIKRAAQPPRAIAITPSPLSPAIPQLQNIALLQPALVPIVSIIGLCLLGMAASLPRALFSESERKKLHRRVFTGFFLGVAVSLWIFSGTWFFLSIFAMFAVIGAAEVEGRTLSLTSRKAGDLGTFTLDEAIGKMSRAVETYSEMHEV